ncbi:MAG: tetratricopeptide repeat protein, partial [Sphingobacteriales bacterium]
MKGIFNPLYLLLLSVFCSLNSMPLRAQEQVNTEDELLRYWEAHLCTITTRQKAPLSVGGKLKDNAIALLQVQKKVAGKPSDTLLLPALNKLMEDLQYKGYELALAFVQFKAAGILYKQYKKAAGIELILHAKEILGNKNYAVKFPGIGSYYTFMGQIYIDNGEPELALQQLQQAAQHNFCEKIDEYYCWGNIGLTYYNLGKTGEALEASYKALEIIKRLGDSAEIVSMLGNIGTIYLKHGDYKNALGFLSRDYEGSIRFERWESAIAVQIMKAKSYLHLGNNDSAGMALKIADSIARQCHCSSYGAKKEYYEQLSKWFSHTKNSTPIIGFTICAVGSSPFSIAAAFLALTSLLCLPTLLTKWKAPIIFAWSVMATAGILFAAAA